MDFTGKTKQGVDMAYLNLLTQAEFNKRAKAAGRLDMTAEQMEAQGRLMEQGRARVEAGDILSDASRFRYGYSGSDRFHRLADAAASADGTASGRISEMRTLFDADEFKRLAGLPGVKAAGLGLLGLVGASFLYQGMTDRSVDDMQGPELLPGGSFYEPTSSPAPEYQTGFRGGSTGTNYNIRIKSSNNDVGLTNDLAGLTGGNASATLYDRGGKTRDTSYDSIAGSY
jgi:hypothetical protein